MRLIDADVLKAKQQEDADLFIGDDTLSGKSRRDEALNAIANIVNAPTIDPVKHGYWIDLNDDGSSWKCSVCGEVQCCNSNYCGDCGAKMDEAFGWIPYRQIRFKK